MGIETALALSIGGLALGAGQSVYSAIQQNDAAKKTKEASGRAATVQSQQVKSAADLERLKTLRRSAQIRGRLRLAAGEAGLDEGSSLDALTQQNELDTGLNLGVIQENTTNRQNLIGSELSVQLARLSGTYRNALLSGFEGGLGGAQQGLQLGSSLERAFPATFGP